MKFVDLKRSIVSKKAYQSYNLFGNDAFLIDSAKNIIINYQSDNNSFNRTILSAETISIDKLDAMLNSLSFFGGNKLIILSDLVFQRDKAVIDYLKKYIENPNQSVVLIIISDLQIISEKESIKYEGKFSLVDCNKLDDIMIKRWIKNMLAQNNATMEDAAIDLLVDYTNSYLSHINIELQKLISYSNGEMITKRDVEQFTTKELEYTVYELTDAMGKNNKEKTFVLLNQMMNDNKMATSVFPLIQNYFRRLFFCSISTGTNAQLAEQLGIKEFAVKKAKEVACNFTKISLKNINQLCCDLDYKIKTSQISYVNAVDYLVVYILENNKK